MPRIGYLGGTFDPVHVGHIAVAEACLAGAGLDSVYLVPASSPPHRPPPIAGAEDRLLMVELAAAGHARLAALDLEVRRGGTSYTVDTVRELLRRDPASTPVLLLGADAAALFPTWKEHEALRDLCTFAVFNRSGVTPLEGPRLPALGFPANTTVLDVVSPPVSASLVRERLAQALDVSSYLPDRVLDHIRKRHLYGS